MALKMRDSFASGTRPKSSRKAMSPRLRWPRISFGKSLPRTTMRSTVDQPRSDLSFLRGMCLRIDEITRRLAGEHAQHLLDGELAHPAARFDRHAGKMRRQHDVVEREQRMSWLQAVMLVHVEHGAGNAPVDERLDEGFLLHDSAAADVDEPCRALHAGEALAVEE